jgi:SAM-dependent methyltransferase
VRPSFEDLIEQASTAPIDGWDFSWLRGRATEERPSWRYFDLVAEAAAGARRMLDVQAGTGHTIHALPILPRLTVAAEGWAPSIRHAAPRLAARGAQLVCTQDDRPTLPFADASFDLVISRHPVRTWWDEVARVLEPGGCYLSQEIGPHSLRELSEALMGPLPNSTRRDPDAARRGAERAGLAVDELRAERPTVTFSDIGAVVFLLRVVVWTVPGFTVDRYRTQLRELHERIERDGRFETTSSRFLVRAHKPTQ